MAQTGQLTVVVFADMFLEPTGVRSYYRTLLEWSRQIEGLRVVIVCPPAYGVAAVRQPADVIVVRPHAGFPNPFYRDILMGYYPRAKLREIVEAIDGPKVIHVATQGPLGIAGGRLARSLRLPCVGWYHTHLQKYARLYGFNTLGPVGGYLGAQLGRIFDIVAYRHCRAVGVPSPAAAQTVKTFFPREVAVIPNSIDVGRFQPGATRQGAFRDRYIRGRKAIVIAVGRVAREKNLDLVGRYLSRKQNISTVLVGDGPYRDVLERRWNVTITGFLEGEELVAAFQQADLFVQLSTTETFGLALAEAMAAGLPAVVLRSPGLVDKIPPGSGVDIMEEDELPALADRCLALVADGRRYEEASRKARAFIQQLGADVVLPQFVEFHRSFL